MQDTDSPSRDLVKAFEDTCRRESLKLTYQRLAILHALANAKDHPGAEDIYEQVKSKVPPISFDTVYRTLALFERFGVIARVQYPDDRARYDPNTASHPHIICIYCKKIEDFHCSTFDEVKIPEEIEQWGLLKSKHLEFRGICRKCLENEKKRGTSG